MKIKNLPKTIYLQIGEDCDHDDWNKIYPSHEVTWCVDKINNNDIVYRLDKRRLGEPKAMSNRNAGYRGKMTREEILKKTKYKFIEKNFDWLERTIEGLLNDFEGGITEKEETMHQFFVLIFDKLVAEIQELRDELSSQLEPPVSDDFLRRLWQ